MVLKFRRSAVSALAVSALVAGLITAAPAQEAEAGSGSISIDAAAVQGVVQPTVVGQMANGPSTR